MDRRQNLFMCSAAILLACASVLHIKQQRKRRRKRLQAKALLHRINRGPGTLSLNMLNNKLLRIDPAAYRNGLRLTNPQFEELLTLVGPHISQETPSRTCFSARNKLQVTLRFLAAGETFRSLMYYTRIHEVSISRIVPEVCKAIIKVLQNKFLKTPATADGWQLIAKQFDELCQFPHCLGALDGRNIKFRPPISAGSPISNKEVDMSLLLFGMADANYKFTYTNLSNGGAFRDCGLVKAIEDNTLQIPESQPLPGGTNNVPYVIAVNEAFPLSTTVMRPYLQINLRHEEIVFNERLSGATKINENAFCILANRFRVLSNPINLTQTKAEEVTVACIVLHNYLCTKNGSTYSDLDENDIGELERVGHQQGANRTTKSALQVREEFKKYFCSDTG